ncbi:pre-mRNA-splicing regulator female-lethal(2)D isoform X2 [Chrysoperla carnea]|uniref:pre-mRNA-splicing regulator female-lethal(2)D isoform X2 n=1 Tax=Chrysoperla carnea TaxID=189513 RepID=UPI001D07B191|nr:pre-mRNA-splicing regulator female-lethal(2)D isoform X2 [Chrysoperla carnea]
MIVFQQPLMFSHTHVSVSATYDHGEINNFRENEERLRAQHAESQQREKVLVRRLAAKEQEMQDVAAQMAELKTSQTATTSGLRSALLDPAVNILLQRLRHELLTSRTRLDETQNELSAWKFTPDSNTGKRLMAKCRLLYTENEELGKLTNSGRVAKLEGELALQKSFSEEVKKSQSELDEFLQDLDEDVEGMQSTIYYLQQELRKTKDSVAIMERELQTLRQPASNSTTTSTVAPSSHNNNNNNITVSSSQTVTNCNRSKTPDIHVNSNITTTDSSPHHLVNNDTVTTNGNCNKISESDLSRTKTNSNTVCDSDSEPELIIKVSDKEICDDDSRDDHDTKQTMDPSSTGAGGGVVTQMNGAGAGGDVASSNCGSAGNNNKRTYDSSDSNESHVIQNTQLNRSCSQTKSNVNKKVRRSSVLSLEYNDDNMLDEDALIISTNGDGTISDAD